LTLHVYYDNKEHKSHLYEDKGDGYDYKEGKCVYKTFTTEGKSKSLTITQSLKGEFETVYKDYDIMVHGLLFTPKSCEADGKEVEFEIINPDKNLIRLTVGKGFGKVVIK